MLVNDEWEDQEERSHVRYLRDRWPGKLYWGESGAFSLKSKDSLRIEDDVYGF